MPLFVQNRQDKVEVPPAMEHLLARVTTEVLAMEGVSPEAEVGITLVDDAAIRELNHNYRHLDCPTDVLSFAMRETGAEEPSYQAAEWEELLGDVVISLETAVQQSKDFGHSLEREVAFLAVHGLLHLLGYDHQEEAQEIQMRQREEEVLGRLGLARE